MNTKRLLLSCLMTIVVVLSACKKEDEGPGNIQVSISYTPPSAFSYVYFLSENFTVKLNRNDSTIATQYTTGGTVDMGVYDYGTYEIQVTGKEGRTSVTTGQTNSDYETFDQTQVVILDSSTKTADFSF